MTRLTKTQEQKEKERKYRNERKERLLKQGICYHCGKNKIKPGRKMCKECLDKVTPTVMKRYKTNIANGICGKCGKRPLKTTIFCEICAENENKRTKTKRKELCESNLCTMCRKPANNGKTRCDKCMEKRRDQTREIKTMVINHYGNTCRCCGEHRIEFLTMDHINGGGRQHMIKIGAQKSSQKFYKWIIKNDFPEIFQTLCFNCNIAKGFFGQCPHEKEKQNEFPAIAGNQ